MRLYALPLVAAIVLAGAVHIISVLAMPRLAQEDAYARLARLGPANQVHLVPDPTPFAAVLPRLDPAFAHAVCRYDLSQRGLALRIPVMPDYLSVSFYTRFGLPFYALSDRAAGGPSIELQLMTPAQFAALPEDEDITAADRLVVESPSTHGLVFIRAFVREQGMREAVTTRLAEARCEVMR